MRLELRDGQWADLRERISHGADKRIKIANRKGKTDDAAALEIDDVLIREYVTAWNVLDVNGSAIALDDADATDRLPEDISDAIAVAAATLYAGATAPNAPTPN